jgi:acetolactate synthase I/II/III large subunit
MDPSISTFAWPSFATIAQSMGATGIRVNTMTELDNALEVVTGTKSPVLLELVLDPATMPRMHW